MPMALLAYWENSKREETVRKTFAENGRQPGKPIYNRMMF